MGLISTASVAVGAQFRSSSPDRLFGEQCREADLGKRSVRSGAVAVGARALNALIQVGSVLFLARLLAPEDYGLVGMVAALTGFAPVLVSLGTPDAVTQRRSITEGEVSALFWISTSLGLSMAAIIALAGPLIAKFYGEPRLVSIAAVSALTFVASALHCQHYALLRRAMMFQDLAVIDVAANLFSAGLAIVMALGGFHYWALALRPVTLNLLIAGGVWWRSGWIPPRPTRTAGVREMLKLGSSITGFTLADFAGRSADRVSIGYRSGAGALGLYQNALFVYDNVLDMLVAPLHGVAVASLSKVTGDLVELRRLWAKALTTLQFYAMPVFGLLSVTGEDFVAILLGPKWLSAGPLLCILALRGIPHSVERTLGWLHVAAGRTDRWMRWGIMANCLQLVAIFCGLPFGARGVVIACVIAMFLLFIPAIAYAGQPLGIGAKDVVKVSWRPLSAALASAAIALVARHVFLLGEPPLVRASALAVVYGLSYLVLAVGLLRLVSPLGVIYTLIREALPERFARRLPLLAFLAEDRRTR